MRVFLTIFLAASVASQGVTFGDSSSEPKKPVKVNQRLGLLGTSLGLSPTGENTGQSGALTQGTNQNTIGQGPSGRVPSGGEFSGTFDTCCCVPLADQCGDPLGRDLEDDLVGLGLIDPRLKPTRGGISTRIVNRPNAATNSQQNTCPRGQKACCYDSSVDHALFGRSCISPGQAQNQETIRYGCSENTGFSSSVKQCGTRNYVRPVSNLQHGESSPGEFPWTCLILNQDNDFIGSCAIIPGTNGGASKVVTAAHKLKDVKLNE